MVKLRKKVKKLQARVKELEAQAPSRPPPPPPSPPGWARFAEAFAGWYRKAALATHPDRGGSDKLMSLVNEVKDLLDKHRR